MNRKSVQKKVGLVIIFIYLIVAVISPIGNIHMVKATNTWTCPECGTTSNATYDSTCWNCGYVRDMSPTITFPINDEEYCCDYGMEILWEGVEGTESYILHVADITDGENNKIRIVDGVNVGYTHSYELDESDLIFGHKYRIALQSVDNHGNTKWGNEVEWSIVNVIEPSVETVGTSNITTDSVLLEGELLSLGNYYSCEYGFYFGESSSISSMTKLEVDDSATRQENYDFTYGGLDSNTKYYYVAYAINPAGESYGDVKSFWTLEETYDPAVSETGIWELVDNENLILYGEVSGTNGLTTEYGFQFWQGDGSVKTTINVGTTTSSSKSYNYQKSFTANQEWYYRTYATNEAGTSYGATRTYNVDPAELDAIVHDATVSCDSGGYSGDTFIFNIITNLNVSEVKLYDENQSYIKSTTISDGLVTKSWNIEYQINTVGNNQIFYVKAFSSNGKESGYFGVSVDVLDVILPEQPYISYPISGEAYDVSPITVQWQDCANTDEYIYSLRDITPGEERQIYEHVSTDASEFTIPELELIPNHQYRVAVASVNQHDDIWGNEVEFYIQGVPEISYPQNGAQLENENFTIVWQDCYGAVNYSVRLETAGGAEIFEQIVEVSQCEVSGIDLNSGESYKIIVAAIDSNGEPCYGNNVSFSVQDIISEYDNTFQLIMDGYDPLLTTLNTNEIVAGDLGIYIGDNLEFSGQVKLYRIFGNDEDRVLVTDSVNISNGFIDIFDIATEIDDYACDERLEYAAKYKLRIIGNLIYNESDGGSLTQNIDEIIEFESKPISLKNGNVKFPEEFYIDTDNVEALTRLELLQYMLLSKIAYIDAEDKYEFVKAYEIPDEYWAKIDESVWNGEDIQTDELYRSFINRFALIDYSSNPKKGFYAVAYLDYDSDTIFISYRGTDGLFSDLLTTDASMAVMGILDNQFTQAISFHDNIHENYPHYNIVVTGHSLGGALGGYVSLMRNVEGHVIDSAINHALNSTLASHLEYSSFVGMDKYRFINYTDIAGIDNISDAVQRTRDSASPLIEFATNSLNLESAATILGTNVSNSPHSIFSTITFNSDEHILSFNDSNRISLIDNEVYYFTGITRVISGSSHDDNINSINGENGVFVCLGGNGNDTIYAYNSMYLDKIIGGIGDDTLYGFGSENYYYYKGDGTDTIVDEDGYDRLYLYGFSNSDTITFDGIMSIDGAYLVIKCNGNDIVKIKRERANGQFFLYIEKEGILGNPQELVEGFFNIRYKNLTKLSVMCPIKVEIYSKSGQLLQTIDNISQTPIVNEYGKFYTYKEEGTDDFVKVAELYNDDYDIKFIGLEDGEMDYQIEYFSEDGSRDIYSIKDIQVNSNSVITTQTDREVIPQLNYNSNYIDLDKKDILGHSKDFNDDNTVDMLDLVSAAQNYNSSNLRYDINYDAAVNLFDLISVANSISPDKAITDLSIINMIDGQTINFGGNNVEWTYFGEAIEYQITVAEANSDWIRKYGGYSDCYSLEVNLPKGDTEYLVQVALIDGNGNCIAEKIRVMTESMQPQISNLNITSPETGVTLDAGNVTLVWMCDGAPVEYSISITDGVETTDYTSTGYTNSYVMSLNQFNTTYTIDLTVADANGWELTDSITITTLPEVTQIVMPNLIGWTYVDARNRLIELGLTPSLVKQYSSTVERYDVISQQYPAGTLLDEGDGVVLYSSTGPESSGNLRITSHTNEDYVNPGAITIQWTCDGYPENTQIHIYDSTGECVSFLESINYFSSYIAPLGKTSERYKIVVEIEDCYGDDYETIIYINTNDQQALIEVPNLYNMDYREARDLLEELGLDPNKTRGSSSAVEFGNVYKQSIAPGTMVEPGTEVEFWYNYD